jgi:hypothetical protein
VNDGGDTKVAQHVAHGRITELDALRGIAALSEPDGKSVLVRPSSI